MFYGSAVAIYRNYVSWNPQTYSCYAVALKLQFVGTMWVEILSGVHSLYHTRLQFVGTMWVEIAVHKSIFKKISCNSLELCELKFAIKCFIRSVLLLQFVGTVWVEIQTTSFHKKTHMLQFVGTMWVEICQMILPSWLSRL